MASGQPAAQTLVLRVPIHCHGCKKKVRKVLKSIQGVHDVEVDAQQHKVLVTGTVDAETLVKRLCKSGKQALPWQHTPAAPAQKPEAPPPANPAEGDGSKDDAAAADKEPAEPVKEPQADDSSDKKPEQETALEKKPEMEKEAESEKKKAEKEEAKATKPSDEANEDGGDGEGPATEPKAKEDTKEAGNVQGEAKKKQSKPDDAPAPAPAPALEHAHQEFNPYNAPQPVMSYHTAQPRASVSHYAPQPEQGYSMRQQPSQPQPGYSSLMHHPPPAPQQAQPMKQWSPSYLYMPYPHASPESYYQDYYSPPGTHAPPPPPPQLQDSYRLFDDENPNSCSVM